LREKIDFRLLTDEMEKELESVKDSPRAIIVMFDLSIPITCSVIMGPWI